MLYFLSREFNFDGAEGGRAELLSGNGGSGGNGDYLHSNFDCGVLYVRYGVRAWVDVCVHNERVKIHVNIHN